MVTWRSKTTSRYTSTAGFRTCSGAWTRAQARGDSPYVRGHGQRERHPRLDLDLIVRVELHLLKKSYTAILYWWSRAINERWMGEPFLLTVERIAAEVQKWLTWWIHGEKVEFSRGVKQKRNKTALTYQRLLVLTTAPGRTRAESLNPPFLPSFLHTISRSSSICTRTPTNQSHKEFMTLTLSFELQNLRRTLQAEEKKNKDDKTRKRENEKTRKWGRRKKTTIGRQWGLPESTNYILGGVALGV